MDSIKQKYNMTYKYIKSLMSVYRFDYFLSKPFNDLNSTYNNLIPTPSIHSISMDGKNKKYDEKIKLKCVNLLKNEILMKVLYFDKNCSVRLSKRNFR